jgi:AmmeMemoRadiSam system protein A
MEFLITEEEKALLLTQARETITAKLENRKPVYQGVNTQTSTLNKLCGAFVILHMINGKSRSLRGCIGRMTANLPLIETVRLMAHEAAFGDPRFPPLSKKEEFNNCQIEISAISPMIQCPDPQQVKIGIHGLYIKKGGNSGVLLPQVPVEQKWSLIEYLEYICVKAGLPRHSYNEPDAELFTFTAVVFREE